MDNSYQKVLYPSEIIEEIHLAERDNRDADFSNRTIQELNITDENIRCGLNFKNSIIVGNLYLSKVKIEGDLIMENAIVGNTLFLGETDIAGNLNAQRLSCKNSCNMIGAIIKKDLTLRRAQISGFLSLNRCFVGGSINAEEVNLADINANSGVIKGDLYAQKLETRGSLTIAGSVVSGVADLSHANIGNKLTLDRANIQGILIMNKTFAALGISDDNLEVKKRLMNI